MCCVMLGKRGECCVMFGKTLTGRGECCVMCCVMLGKTLTGRGSGKFLRGLFFYIYRLLGVGTPPTPYTYILAIQSYNNALILRFEGSYTILFSKSRLHNTYCAKLNPCSGGDNPFIRVLSLKNILSKLFFDHPPRLALR